MERSRRKKFESDKEFESVANKVGILNFDKVGGVVENPKEISEVGESA